METEVLQLLPKNSEDGDCDDAEEAVGVPVLLWNNSHPDVLLGGLDSKGLLVDHLLVLRCQLGVYWGRALLLRELTSTEGVRSLPPSRIPRRYYHVSLPCFQSGL